MCSRVLFVSVCLCYVYPCVCVCIRVYVCDSVSVFVCVYVSPYLCVQLKVVKLSNDDLQKSLAHTTKTVEKLSLERVIMVAQLEQQAL